MTVMLILWHPCIVDVTSIASVYRLQHCFTLWFAGGLGTSEYSDVYYI